MSKNVAANIYEYLKCYDIFSKYINETNDDAIPVLNVREIRKHVGYKISKKIRNKISSHYSSKEIEEFIKNDPGQDKSFELFFHEMVGNSISNFPEAYYIQSLIEETTDLETGLTSYVDWILDTSKEILDYHYSVFVYLMDKYFPKKNILMKDIHPEQDDIVSASNYKIPLYLSPDRKI